MSCEISRETIKTGIQDSIGKSLDMSGLFNRVSPFEDTAARLEDAKKHAAEVVDTYRQQFLDNPEQFLRDVAAQAASSRSESQGALDLAGYNLFDIASELYGESNLFSPKDLKSPYTDVIQSLNNQFGEEVLINTKAAEETPVYKSIPSEALVDAYELAYTGENTKYSEFPYPYIGIDPNDIGAIQDELGLTDNSTPQDFIDMHMKDYSEQIANIRKANPTFTMEFTDEFSQFDPLANKVLINLGELSRIAQNSNIPLSQVVSIYTMHELGHAGTAYANENGNATADLQEFYKVAQQYDKTNPFEDVLRQGFREADGTAYGLKNINEFAAEAYSNPFFQDWLRQIPSAEKKSLFHAIIDKILEFFGFKNKPSLYDNVIESINSNRVQEANREGSEHPTEDWHMDLVYHGNPKTYTQAAFELFTNPALTDEIDKILTKLPGAVVKIKQQLDSATNKEEINKLQSLLNAYNDVKENDNVIKVGINMLTQAGFIARDMEQALLEIPKLKTTEDKLALSYSLLKNTQSLEFITPLAEDVRRAILRENAESAAIRPFLNLLTGISAVTNSVKKTYLEVTQPLILDRLSEFVGETQAEKDIKQRIIDLQARLASTADNTTKGFIEKQIINERELLKLIPSRTNFELILQGQYRDSSSGQYLFEAAMMNDHPINNTMTKMIRQNNMEVSQLMLPLQNEHQKQLDELRKAIGYGNIRNTEDFNKPITVLVSRADSVVENENGEPVLENGLPKFNYTTQRMLLSEYSPDYTKQATEKKAMIDYYYKKLSDANRLNNDEAIQLYRSKLNQAYKDRTTFYRENSENQYKDEILDMYDLLQKEVTKPDGTVTTFGAERGYIFEAIHDAEDRREAEINQEALDKLQEEIEVLYTQQGQLRSKWDENGNEKTGFEKEIADIATQYSDLKQKYGKWETTEKGEAMFQKEVLTLQRKLDNGLIDQKTYDARIAEIAVTELSDEYYDAIKYYTGRIDDISQQLAAIPEFKNIFKGVDSEAIREGYNKIRDLVRGFRDSELTIDGQLFSKVRPELVKEIQKIQQQVEDLKASAEKMKGLSIENTVRLKELNGKSRAGTLTNEEKAELDSLKTKSTETDRLYLQYKDLIDEYSDLLKEFSQLNDSKPSKYYQQELDHQTATFVAQRTEAVMKQIQTSESLQEGKYQKRNGIWEEVKRIEQGYKVVEDIDKNGFKTVEEALANRIAREQAGEDIKGTDWWKQNHYQKYVWNQKQGYIKVDSPIYIWVKTEPQDPSFIKEQQPSIKFKSYTINDEYRNPNFSVINDNLPAPKKDLHRDSEYARMKNSSDPRDKAYMKYLEFARASMKRAQQFIPEERRLGDILPSFVKTGDELAVERTNSVAGKAMAIASGQWKLAALKTDNTDEQILTGGSTSDFFAKNKILPIRFSGRMSYEKQSADIAAMVLSYELAALEYNKMLEDQPFFEAIRTAVENLPVLEAKKLGAKISWGNLFPALKSKTVVREKKTDESNLAKTVNHILSTQVYGETKTSANINVGGIDFDLNKAARGLKHMSSLSIFSLNAFVAVKNSISAIIQANLQANISKGFFTRAQYNAAHLEAILHIKDYLADFRRFGNKTKIGQEMDFFQVMQGASYNEFGKKTAFTAIKNTESFLTALKNSSEFELQVAQYLAMSKANPVQLADGTWVEMRKAFELNKDGNLVPIAGAKVTEKQIESFMFKLAYVNRIINGAYRAEEKNAIQKNVLGDLLFYLNGYIVPGIVARFGKSRYSAEGDLVARGYINQFVQFVGELAKYRGDIAKRWSVMSADEKNRVKRGANELAVIVGMGILVAAMGGNAPDKKHLQQNEAIQNWALGIALAVKAETETFVPLPGYGLNDMARKMNSPFAAVRQVSNIVKALQNFSLYVGDQVGISEPSAYYKSSSIKDGFHDKGDPKFIANFLKLIGWSGIGFDPVAKAQQISNFQQLR